MGSIMVHYFLQQQSPEWKEKHIRFMGHDLEFWVIHFLVQCFVSSIKNFLLLKMFCEPSGCLGRPGKGSEGVCGKFVQIVSLKIYLCISMEKTVRKGKLIFACILVGRQHGLLGGECRGSGGRAEDRPKSGLAGASARVLVR